MAVFSVCSAAVAAQLGADPADCGTKGRLQAALFAAGWECAIDPGREPAQFAPARRTAGAMIALAVRELSRDEALLIYTDGHVLCIDGRHRVVVDTARPDGRDRRQVDAVVPLRRRLAADRVQAAALGYRKHSRSR